MEAQSVFDFSTYKDFLLSFVGDRTQRKGAKSAFAKAIRCQPTYISQVLYGNAHLSLEQAEALARFLGLSNDELLFFLLLVQKDRSGTQELKAVFQQQIDIALSKRLVLTARLGAQNNLSPENQSVYYSSWHYAAIHIAVTIPSFQSKEALSEALGLPMKKIAEVLEFLVSTGLVITDEGKLKPGHSQLRLGNDSHNILKHHTNWRQRAIESLDQEALTDLHYSAVVSLSKEDVLKIKDRLLEALKDNLKLIRNSKEEELYCYCIDFFNLKKQG